VAGALRRFGLVIVEDCLLTIVTLDSL
jgi:hypothetical protein